MNKDWSNLNKQMQDSLKNKDGFAEGIKLLKLLRSELLNVIDSYKDILNNDEFSLMPCMNAKGFHNKNVAYSLWHIFRIEDIVVNSLIMKREQIFFKYNYQSRMNSSIISTGNELVKSEISLFTKELNIAELYNYINDVNSCTIAFLDGLEYKDLKKKFNNDDKEYLISLNCVNDDFLLDYWCGKDIRGLIFMPLSRHWIMHIEASNRIIDKLKKA